MGRELGPHPEVARLRTTPGPPALRKLSAVSGASPGTSPRSATARQAGSMSRSRSSGSGLGPSVDTLQPAAADAGAGSGSGDAAAAAAAQGGPSGTAPAAAPGSTSPDLPSTLAALHALNPPTANGTAVTAAAGAQQGGKQHSKHSSFFGMFQRTPKSGKPGGPSDAASEEHGSSSAGEGKAKKSSSWFGFGGGKKRPGSASPLPSPNGVPPLAAAGRTASGCLLLPGLPIVEGRSGSRPGSRAGSSTGGSEAAAAASGGGTPGAVAGLRAGYAGDVSASDASAPSSARPSPAVAGGLPPGIGSDPGTAQRKSHRRHRSLTALLLKPGWRRRSNHSVGSEGELGGDITPPRYSSYGPSRAGSPAPESAKALAAAGGYGACFGLASGGHTEAEDEVVGMPSPIEEEVAELPPQPLLPSGTTGLKNIGNTCFFNAALQCLRYTPGLPLQVVPDLLQLAEQRRQPGKAAAKSVSFAAGPPAVAAAACAGGSACSASGGEAAGEESGLEEQPSLDVHQQALARASCELPPEAVEAARRELEAVSSGVDCDAAAAAAAASGTGAAGAEGARTAAEAGSGAAAGEAAASGVASEQQAQQQPNGPAAAAAPPAAAPAAAAPAAPAGQPGKPQRPSKGALLEAFATLVKDLYLQPENGEPTACAAPLLRTLRAFPIAADYFDGGQHDCQEVLRVVMDLLHEDLNRAAPKQQQQQPQANGPSSVSDPPSAAAAAAGTGQLPGGAGTGQPAAEAAGSQQAEQPQQAQQNGEQPQQGKQPGSSAAQQGAEQLAGQQQEPPPSPQQRPYQQGEGDDSGGQQQPRTPEDEAAKAERLWQQYLERDDSPISDLFGGQLQSSVTCHKCGGRFTMYEPFWDLSLPLSKEGRGGGFSWLGLKGSPSSIQDCLTAFTADERLEGEEAFHCETCKEKTPATKHLRVHRFPEVLVLHIKRFKHKGNSTDKLTTSVTFPLRDLSLHQFASPECPARPEELRYELFAVSNHYGNLSGGHYTAMCRVPQPDGDGEDWYSFNDESVVRVSPSQVVSQYAYVLWYVRSRKSSIAAAAAGRSHHHRRTSSAASAGAAAAVASG